MAQKGPMDPDRFQMKDIKRRLALLETHLGYKLDRRVRELVNSIVAEVITIRVIEIIEDQRRQKGLLG